MIKNLLSIAAMTFFALGASAETLDLTLADLGPDGVMPHMMPLLKL